MFYIYKLENCNYVGSAIDLKERKRQHIKRLNNGSQFKVYKFIRENKITINLIPIGFYKRECSNKIRKLVEQFYINKYNSINCGLNTYNAFRSKKQIREYNNLYNKNHIKNKIKYRNSEKGKKKIKEYRKKRNSIKINCVYCNSLVIKNNILRHQKTPKCKKFQ